MSNKEKKINLYNYELRILPYYVPLNTILLQENIFGTGAVVKDSGLRFTFGKGQARKIELKTYDFKEQKIDGKDQIDIYLDFSVDYQIGARLDEKELADLYGEKEVPESTVIKSKNRTARRTKLFKLFLRAENNLDVSMEQILMNIVRKKLTGETFESIQKIGNEDTLFEQIKDEYYAECIDKLGVEIIDLRISNIHLANDVNKLFNEKRIAEEQAKIKKIEAEGEKTATLIRANAEKKAEIIKAQGEAEKIKLTEGAKNEMDAQRIENFKDEDYKKVLASTSPENMNKVTEKNINLVGIDAIINSIKENVKVAPVTEEVVENVVAPEETEVKDVITEAPVAEEVKPEVVEDIMENSDFFDDKKEEPVVEEKNTIESINDYREVVPEEKTTEEMIQDLQTKDPELLAKAIDSVIAEDNNEAEITDNDFNFGGTINVEEIKDEDVNGFQKSIGSNNNI